MGKLWNVKAETASVNYTCFRSLTIGRGKGGRALEVRDQEAQTIMYKISYKDISHNMSNIATIL